MDDQQPAPIPHSRKTIFRSEILKYVFILPAAIWITGLHDRSSLLGRSIYFRELCTGERDYRIRRFCQLYQRPVVRPIFGTRSLLRVIYVLIAVPLEVVLGFLLAWFVTLCPREHNIFRPILTAPLFTMEVALGYLGITLFTSEGGLFSAILNLIGVSVPWMTTAYGGLAATIILDVWRWTPFVFLISLAGLAAIPDQLYEAALLETSNYRQLMFNIALPLAWPVLSVALLLRLIEGLKTFGLPLALTGGGPGISTQLFSILNYYTTIQFFDFGKGSAMAILYLIFVSVAISFIFKSLRKSFE